MKFAAIVGTQPAIANVGTTNKKTMRVFAAGVDIYKGTARTERIHKRIEVAFDDLPPDITDEDLKEMVRADVNDQLTRTADFPLYGKNWTINYIEEI